MKKFYTVTLGCPKNIVDSERIAARLGNFGMEIADTPDAADAIIINTCGFITPAKEESIQAIFESIELKKSLGIKKLVVCGCLSQRYMSELKRQIPEVDYFFGIDSYDEIAEALAGKKGKAEVADRILSTPNHYAYLKIAEGCDRKCSFCAIPLIKGKFKSRKEDEIIREAESLRDKGVKEINLIAQDTNYYGVDLYYKPKLNELLKELCKVDGIEWIRLLYTYPKNFSPSLVETIAEEEKICNYVDIPLQHISEKVLKSMKRGVSAQAVRGLITKIRKNIPNVVIRSAFIVGYPYEEESDFELLKEFIREQRLDRVGVFTYSAEEGTQAYNLGDPVPEEVKNKRLDELMKMQAEISLEKNKSLIGQKVKVLADEILDDGSLLARTEGDAPEIDNAVIVKTEKNIQPGDFIEVVIKDAETYDLYAEA